jgi:hypothetical protein
LRIGFPEWQSWTLSSHRLITGREDRWDPRVQKLHCGTRNRYFSKFPSDPSSLTPLPIEKYQFFFFFFPFVLFYFAILFSRPGFSA